MSFCAICTSDRGPFTRHPVGKNGGLVVVCQSCATEEPDTANVKRRAVTREPRDPRAATIKANRDWLTANGLCMYGRNHGKATAGRLCATCQAKYRARGR